MQTALTILLEAHGAAASQLRINWDAKRRVIAAEARAMIERRWAVHLAESQVRGRPLHDGAITRFVDVRAAGSGITLDLAAGSYKDFLVSVLRDRAWFLEHAPGDMTAALGNSVLLTRGKEALLGIRSERVSAYAGRAHLIGGALDELGSASLPADGAGIIAHLRREMAEEAGIGEDDLLGEPRLLAVARDDFLAQPELIWQWELAGDVDAIGRRLAKEEHTGWVVVKKEGIEPAQWDQMTPVARAAWERWRSF